MLGLPSTTVGQSGGTIGSVGPSGEPVPNYFIRPLIGPPSAGYPPRDPPPSFAIPPLIGPPSIGLPLPQIGVPLPPIGLQPHIDWNRRARHHRRGPVFVYPPTIFVMPYSGFLITQTAVPEPVATTKEPETGSLVLQVEPGTAQVFVDGYYVGTPDDLNAKRDGLVLETGAHKVDINAIGYESVGFDVKISPNQSIVYRRVLKALEVAPPPAPFIPTRPATFYMIPGCYLGSVPPSEAKLPATCDISRAQTFTIK
jgi:hypothetical protein